MRYQENGVTQSWIDARVDYIVSKDEYQPIAK